MEKKTRKTDCRSKLTGLYAITRTRNSEANTPYTDDLVRQVISAIRGGARIIQYRDKSGREIKRREEAEALLQVCRDHTVPLIINDDINLTQVTGADGVHLGSSDADYVFAREQLGPDAIIGISCYNQPDLALRAQTQGADYVAFGRFFPSRNKPQAVQADEALLHQTRAQLTIPIVAIGGITHENGRSLVKAGADMLAVIDAVFGRDLTETADIEVAARQLAGCFDDAVPG